MTIVLLPGDGIGPEVVASAVEVLAGVGEFDFAEFPFGADAIERCGTPLPAEALTGCRSAEAVLAGAVGTAAHTTTPGSGLLRLRAELGLYANLRPVRAWLEGLGPLRPDVVAGADLVIVRELTGGLYVGAAGRSAEGAYDTCAYTAGEIERVARVAFRLAQERRGRVTSVDKANVLETSRLWRETVTGLGQDKFPGVELEHLLVDSAALALVSDPRRFDVVVTENLFGDILSDEAAAIAGSLGLLPSASLGDTAGGLFEPVHGSAPDIAGLGIANPCAAILSAALLLRYALYRDPEAAAIEAAVARTLRDGIRTPDLGGTATTAEVTRAVLAGL
ncbi:3-isopropylmalate dehydrogenase [Amycolatopsis bartoniae]|uniref:3-isopropylmalate dehydrogenase n=1 Tax=Amycolatopsis bartoniae TaxID=941986 RepID=A0A8H9IXW3_9PSEU|nr:3-isopropylmalate dehydrogenase [Amycolatopsis bartoniae]MBB2939831.1 3-isopropylmalate dehydrogenase [Amycolatopsis bartoniae]TVT07464.1 3-isopropylmalate dehydrogenase [Amycolatopsis bartoniae]GHF54808.1 3-isopropylmalate dehydrogenase [Amycolatopsis bartoniae]